MIKNRAAILNGLPVNIRRRRKILLDIIDYVLLNSTPEKLLKSRIRARDFSSYKKIALIAIGKAAKGMVRATVPSLGRAPDYLLLAHEGHPLPTKKGIYNTERIIRVAHRLTKDDCAIVLISGGGSAMLVSPAQKITLENKIVVTQELLKCGATIQEINVIRKHLSQVKGGNLAALLYPATVAGFVISDVIGNDLSTIASGPLSPDPTTFADALGILKKYRVTVPTPVLKHFEAGQRGEVPETAKPGEKYFERVQLSIIADHHTVAELAIKKARSLGLQAKVEKKYLSGEASIEGAHFATRAMKHGLTIACGESTVTCKGKGHGGRNQEFVLAGLKYLKKNQTLLSIGTDGVDGTCPEKVAGALADFDIKELAIDKKLRVEDFLKRNDSYSFFKKTDGLIKTGITGTNLGDCALCLN